MINQMDTIHVGDSLRVLRTLSDESVHCIVTSPPYYGLRDYKTGRWKGGDPKCDHVEHTSKDAHRSSTLGGPGHRLPESNARFKSLERRYRSKCRKCGAVRIDEQIGMERSPQDYIDCLAAVFRECRRVLHSTGTLWLNLGDTYANTTAIGTKRPNSPQARLAPEGRAASNAQTVGIPMEGVKPKDRLMIPARTAIALQDDGWYLRDEIIWAKGNTTPFSGNDRTTPAHEMIYVFSKRPRYFYNIHAIKSTGLTKLGKNETAVFFEKSYEIEFKVHPRSIWMMNTKPYKDAHFAVFPRELPRRCILAGSSEGGCCSQCMRPYEFELEQINPKAVTSGRHRTQADRSRDRGIRTIHRPDDVKNENLGQWRISGWKPGCDCDAPRIPCVVMDPFFGAGTTGLVARSLGRSFIGIELSRDYARMARKRIMKDNKLDHRAVAIKDHGKRVRIRRRK